MSLSARTLHRLASVLGRSSAADISSALSAGGSTPVASAQVSVSVGTLNPILHTEDLTSFIFDQGAVSDAALFDVNAGGIEIKEPGLYHAEFSMGINNLVRGGAATKLFLIATLPDDLWVNGAEYDAYNSWMQYGLDAMVEVTEGPQLVSCKHAVMGGTTDISSDVWPALTIYRVGDLETRPALVDLA